MQSRTVRPIGHFFRMRREAAARRLAEAMSAHDRLVQDLDEQHARMEMLQCALVDLQSAQRGMSRIALYERSRKVGIVLAQINDVEVNRYELQLQSDDLLSAAREHQVAAVLHHRKTVKIERWMLQSARERRMHVDRMNEREIEEEKSCRKSVE